MQNGSKSTDEAPCTVQLLLPPQSVAVTPGLPTPDAAPEEGHVPPKK